MSGREPTGADVDELLSDLDELWRATCVTQDRVWARVEDGTLSLAGLRRLACEHRYLGAWRASGVARLVASAPAGDLAGDAAGALDEWLTSLAFEGLAGAGPDEPAAAAEWCHLLGLSEQDVAGSVPAAETIGLALAGLYHASCAWPEGLASLGWVGERCASLAGRAGRMHGALRDHYGLDVDHFARLARGDELGDGDRRAEVLLRPALGSTQARQRVRTCVVQALVLCEARTVAMNAWLDEPAMLR